MSSSEVAKKPLTAVVIAGAVARGAYEAAALAALLPRVLDNLESVIFLGTSAGAINAALWARFTDGSRSVEQVGAAVMDVWRSIDDTDVFGPLIRTLTIDALKLVRGFTREQSLRSLINPEALRRTANRHLPPDAIGHNIANGAFRGVGLAATFCGKNPANSRTHLFWQGAPAQALPTGAGGSDGGIDYRATTIRPEHVLASSAVPVLFEPVQIRQPGGAPGWYVDGGVRLNTPIAPAIELGAERVIVISSHTAEYAPPSTDSRIPDACDALALSLHSVLADGMIEDLRRLREKNHVVEQSSGRIPHNRRNRAYRRVEHIVVAPPPGRLAEEARAALRCAPWHSARAARYRLLDAAMRGVGTGPGRDELLSYMLFDPVYFERQFALGAEHARDARWRT
jgi:NTE family protein